MKVFFQILMLLALLVGAGAVRAQFTLPEFIALEADPFSPSPGETFQVKTEAPTFNLASSRFSWSVDGRVRPDLSGIGRHTVSLIAGGVGTVTDVRVTVKSADGRAASTRIFVRPAELVLHWTAESYVPRWYRGKPLPVPNSVVNIVAIPRVMVGSVSIKPENLTYYWSLDDQSRALVGAGEQIFRVRTSDFRQASHIISVVVQDPGQTISKEAQISISNFAPKAVVYRRTPLGGIEPRQALGKRFIPTQRGFLDLQAEPFFLAEPLSRAGLSFGWSVAGLEAAGTPDNPHILTIDTERAPAGEIPISVRVGNGGPLVSAIIKTINLILE